MDATTRAQIEAAVASLSLPWNAECVRGGIRHLARNVDHDVYSSVEEEHNCPNRQDGGAVALIVNNAPALLAAAQEAERLRKGMTFDCQAQGCREPLNHLEMDRLEAEVARLTQREVELLAAAVRADEDAKVERLFKWLTEGAPKYFSRDDVRTALRGQP